MSVATEKHGLSVSESTELGMSSAKRKSPARSASPSQSGDGDAPNKRLRVERVASPNAEAGEHANRSSSISNQNEHQQSTIPTDCEREDMDAVATSDEQHRRASESSKHEASSPTALRSSDRDRPPPDVKRHEFSPPPSGRDRRGSEVSRRGSSSNQAVSEGRVRDRRSVQVNRDEERKRGKRLFGGLLSTLSQTTTNSVQKRRQEIEKKQQEKATKQKIEDDKRRAERLAKLDGIRKIEQVRFDEQVMRTRHSNMLAMAHSLHTMSEPRLYYRPWELTPEQEDIIKDQIRDAEARIEDELQQFRRRKAQQLADLKALPHSLESDVTVGEPDREDRSNRAAQDVSDITATNDRKQSPTPLHKEGHEERDHDEMVEAEEDTVIY